MQNIPPELLIAVTEIEGDSEIILYEIDLTNIGGVRYRFHDGANELLKPIIWQGQQYEPYPIVGEGSSLTVKYQPVQLFHYQIYLVWFMALLVG